VLQRKREFSFVTRALLSQLSAIERSAPGCSRERSLRDGPDITGVSRVCYSSASYAAMVTVRSGSFG